MKKLILTFILFANVVVVNAIDRIVNEAAPFDSYATIRDAVNAAQLGDRVVVYPRIGGGFYSETIYPTPGIQIVSAIEGQYFKVQGTIHIISINAPVTIVGMELTGDVISDEDNATFDPVAFNLISCHFISGIINIAHNNYDLYLANSKLENNRITFKRGSVIGNSITNLLNSSTVLTVGAGTNNCGTVRIIGNRILLSGGNNTQGILFSNSQAIAFISNNYITGATNQAFNSPCIRLLNAKTNGSPNYILNNTVVLNFMFGPGIKINVSNTTMLNNIVVVPVLNSPDQVDAFYITANVITNYNYISNDVSVGLDNNVNNHVNSTILLNLTDGNLQPGSDGINGGDPSASYLDLDLTRNDAGWYGGSFSQSNFNSVTGPTTEVGARVLMMNAPRIVYTSHGFTIKGDGVDK